jgi:hypothetical protein
VVTDKLDSINKTETPPLVCIETATVPIKGIFVARALSRVGPVVRDAEQPTSQPAQARTDSSAKSANVMLTNFIHEELTLPKATVLGMAEEISEEVVDAINKGETANAKFSTKHGEENGNDKLYQKVLVDKLDHFAPREKQLIEPVLKGFAHVFHDEDTNDFKSTNVREHRIIITDPTPIRRPHYRTPFALHDEMDSQVKYMLRKGVIRKSQSPLSASAIIVPKKSLDGKQKFRFCVDFRALNAVTKFDSYPLPHL